MSRVEGPRSLFEGLKVDTIFKIAALLLAMGILVGKLNGLDDRLSRLERFMDSHVLIQK